MRRFEVSSLSFAFDEATIARRAGNGRWDLDIDPGWSVRSHPNGGYLMALMVRALLAEVGQKDPRSVTAHYLRPTSVGCAEMTVDVFRTGRSLTHAQACLMQGTERVRIIAAFGELGNIVAPTFPLIPPAEPTVPFNQAGRQQIQEVDGCTVVDQIDTRVLEGVAPVNEQESRYPCLTSWVRFADGRPPDVLSLFLFSDPFPPAVVRQSQSQWVPTVELTVHIWGRPHPGWLRARFETRVLKNGYAVEDGELWDEGNNLVAQSRQLALLLPE